MFDPDSPNRIINYRPLFIAAVGFISGVALYEAFSSFAHASAILLPIVCIIFAALFLFSAIKRKRTLLVLSAAFLLAFARMTAAAPDNVVKGEYRLTGTVLSINHGKTDSVILTGASLDDHKLKYRVKLTISSGELPTIGDRITASCSAREPSRRFGSYDERLDLLSKDTFVIAAADKVSTLGTGMLPLTEKLYNVKSFLRDRIYLLFSDEAPIAAGFLLGEKAGLDEADVDSFRATGTAHLLSLSGFHVGVLTSLLFFILPKRFPWMRMVFVSLFLLGYCAVAAFPASLIRASLMCFCLMLSEVTEERRDSLSSLSLAALVILAFSPYSLWSVGFQLSFAATFGILLILSVGEGRSASVTLRRIRSAASVTLGATAASALISARYFGVFPTYGLAANIIAVPIFSAAITLSFFVLVIGVPFPAIAQIAAWVPRKLIGAAMFIIRRIESLPYSSIEVISPSLLSGVLMLIMLFTISAYVLRPIGKRLKLTALAFLLFTASLAADIIKV